jgi:hypothetical protein
VQKISNDSYFEIDENERETLEKEYESYKNESERDIKPTYNNFNKKTDKFIVEDQFKVNEKTLENIRKKYNGSVDELLEDFYKFSDYIKKNNNHKYSVLFATMFYFFLEKKINKN